MPETQAGISYTLIRGDRRTLSLEVKNGGVLVRAPRGMPLGEIEAFLAAHKRWIGNRLARQRAMEAVSPLSPEALAELKSRAGQVIPERVAHFAPLVGVDYGKITIRCQKTRWGSCSARGNLSFNCLLMLAPPEVLDSVVVHELCHRKHMNHSPAFYQELHRVCPNYQTHHRWLKQNAPTLLAQAGGQIRN